MCDHVFVTSTCEGSCKGAWYTVTEGVNSQGTVCNPQYKESYSCASKMPCVCRFADLLSLYPVLDVMSPQWGGALTCGDCSEIVSGNSCNFICGNGQTFKAYDQNSRLVDVGAFSSILCTDDGWPDFGANSLFLLPQCAVAPPSCPNVLGIALRGDEGQIDLGFSPNPKSRCVGATRGDRCTVSCSPSYYAPNNQFVATCTSVTKPDGTQVLDWYPWNADSDDGHMRVCVCQGCRSALSDNFACPCQVSSWLTSAVCPV